MSLCTLPAMAMQPSFRKSSPWRQQEAHPTYASSHAQVGEEEHNPAPASVLAGAGEVVDSALDSTAAAGAVASPGHLA